MSDDNYTDKFIACQSKMSEMLKKCPPGCQNWSYQKSVNFKKLCKKVEAAIKLLPKSKHTDFLKVEQLMSQLEGYYR